MECGGQIAGRPEMRGGGQALGSCLAGEPGPRDLLGRTRARPKRPLPIGLELIKASKAAFRLREGFAVVGGPAALRDLLIRSYGLGKLAAQLRALPQALHGGKPFGLVLAFGPALERSAKGASRLSVAMQGEERLGGGEQHRSGPTGFPSGHPMLGDRPGRPAQSLEAFPEQTMVGAPSRPWNVPV